MRTAKIHTTFQRATFTVLATHGCGIAVRNTVVCSTIVGAVATLSGRTTAANA